MNDTGHDLELPTARMLLCSLLVIACVIGPAVASGADRLRVSIDGADVPRPRVASVRVDQDLDQPDMAAVVIEGRNAIPGHVAPGDDVTIEVEPKVASLFKGEIVTIEPVFTAGQTTVIVRAFNRLHRLTRGVKTRSFDDVTDAEIVGIIAREHGLVPAPGDAPPTRHDHVFQHNQTDLEFLRVRAGLIGFDVWVDDRTLNFARREPAPAVAVDGVKTFHPGLASSATVQRVIVRGRDLDQREILGIAIAPTISLDPDDPDPDRIFGQTLAFSVDQPIASIAEAQAIAKAKLAEHTLSYLSGEAVTPGHPGLQPGTLATIDAVGDRFDGKYLIVRATHRYSHGEGCRGEYGTALQLRREDLGLFRIPRIDDEVLVAFEHGDLRQPVVVGSLWDTDDPCAGRAGLRSP